MKIENGTFGIIDIDPIKGAHLFRVPIFLNGRTSPCNLYLDKALAQNTVLIDKASNLLKGLDKLDQRAREALVEADKKGDETVAGFIDFHLEEVPEKIAKKLGKASIDHGAFLLGLDLCGIAIHSENNHTLSIGCDYTIGKDFTDGVLAVRFDESYQITGIAHES